jgi:hypothetical protein
MFVKTSEELGQVMSVDETDKPTSGFSAYRVMLKVPKMTHENGIQYQSDFFYPEELETRQERAKRFYEEMFEEPTPTKLKASETIDKMFGTPVKKEDLKN